MKEKRREKKKKKKKKSRLWIYQSRNEIYIYVRFCWTCIKIYCFYDIERTQKQHTNTQTKETHNHTYRVSDPRGTDTSSSKTTNIPFGFFSIKSNTSWLSIYSIWSKSIPSALYVSSSKTNVFLLKCCCNFSLQKLIHNCSNEFDLKISKPKISRIPIKLPLKKKKKKRRKKREI